MTLLGLERSAVEGFVEDLAVRKPEARARDQYWHEVDD